MLVRRRAPKFVLVICVVTAMGACSDPPPASGSEATVTSVLEPASTTTSSTVATTTTPTSTSTPGDGSTSTPTVPVAGDPPHVELKEPGYYEGLPPDEVANYFIFGYDVSPSHSTTYTSSGPAETWSMTARTDGELVHYVGTGRLAGEMITSGGDVWVREAGGEWVIDEDMFELPIFVAFPSPDFAYAVAYGVFDDLEFVGWVENGGDDVAVYAGGADASAKVMEGLGEVPSADHDGSVEVWWSPDGYFAKVEVEMSTATGDLEMSWTVTDVGTTEVEPPA
jgi:hypothetical protein